jgi:hypothetical protein
LIRKTGAVALLVLMSLAFALAPLELVFGQNQNLGVTIIQVTPSGLTGSVGQAVNVQGTIYTSNGTYQIILGTAVVDSGISEGFYVNANFSVPEVPTGSYSLVLRDVAVNVNSTGSSPESFQVTTGYSISAAPSQAQEGSSVALTIAVTGATPATAYNANVTVVLPGPLSTKYSKVISLGTASQKGTASAQVTFPDSSFQPSGSLTDYVGSYTVYFNQSSSLAQSQFSIGFLDKTTYHRGQTVTIHATGYQPNQAATLSVASSATGAELDSVSVTSSADGVISTTWVVSSNAAIGDYNVRISSQGTQKSIQDSQTFSIIGYAVKVKTTNLAGEIVPQIRVQAQDQLSGSFSNSTSGLDGIANLKLETGSQSLSAFWNNVNVGQTNITVTGDGTFSLQCQLANLKIIVQNENGTLMPFVNLAITYRYQPSGGGSSQVGNSSGQTDPSGSFTLTSTLTGIGYNINASLYNQVFNSGNNTINNLPAQALSEVLITCPNEALTINVVGYDQAAIPDARIELVELTSGLFYAASTDSSGSAVNLVTFGKYRARIYKDDILINETNIEAFGESQKLVRCTLYDIQLTVSVVDFFGRPIPNMNVTLNGPKAERFSALTKDDGIVTFNNVIGGDMQITAYASGAQNDYQAITLAVVQPTSVQIKIDRYVALGSYLIQASSLITIAVILAAIVLFAIVEIYRRRKVRNA